jgi:cytochrome P450
VTSPHAITNLEFDPYSYEQDEDPYPIYRRMRDEAPLYYNPRLDFYALTRFEDCRAAFIDWKTFSSARGTVLELMDVDFKNTLIIFMDPPRQTALRNLVSKVFTPRRIAALEPEIRAIACGYLDPLRETHGCDIVRDFTANLPMDVISTLLGIPPEDRDHVRELSNAVLHREPGSPQIPPSALAAMPKLLAYFESALAERRTRPRDDIMTLLLQAELREPDGALRRLRDDELCSFFNLLATAGNETVTKFLATAFHCLGEFPGERQRLLDDPALIPNAVDETLRYDPPSQYQGRTLSRTVEIHGGVIPEGAKLLLINAASGRDERAFPDPDRFDVGRPIETHVNFGWGQHICLGKNLALLESRIAIEEFLQRIPHYEVDPEGIERMHSSNVRGFKGLRLRY